MMKKAIWILFLLICLEGALRFQQWIGPIYDFTFPKYDLRLLSDTLNHVPHPRFGYDQRGIRLNRQRPIRYPQNIDDFRIIFMGDSFMHGYPDLNTIPQNVWEYFQTTDLKEEPLVLLNAGYSSYSPAIYIPQAKILIEEYKPDMVVLDIDETDLVDDFASYRHRVTRDEAGRIVGVKRSPAYFELVNGYVQIKKQPLYVMRLVMLLVHKGIRMPIVAKWYKQKYKSKYYENPLSDSNRRFSYNLLPAFDFDHDVDQYYAEEISYFKQNVRELMETLLEKMGESKRILILYHPHIYHLMPDPQGKIWRKNVASIVGTLAEEYGIPFYDASEDLRGYFNQNPEAYYFDNDMHFNYEGFEIYSNFIGEKLYPVIRDFLSEGRDSVS